MARLPLLHSDDAPSSASETLKKKNYLPEWLLESKRALEVSASNREVVEAKLSELKTGIDLLGDTIDEHRRRNKERSAREKAGLPPLSSYLTSTSAELCLEGGGGGGGGCDLRNLQPLGLHYLPTVLTNIVAGFSCCADLLIFAGTCAAAHDYLKQEECWLELHRRHCLFIWTCNPSADLRALAVCPRRIFRGKSPLPPEALLSSNRNGGAGGGGAAVAAPVAEARMDRSLWHTRRRRGARWRRCAGEWRTTGRPWRAASTSCGACGGSAPRAAPRIRRRACFRVETRTSVIPCPFYSAREARAASETPS